MVNKIKHIFLVLVLPRPEPYVIHHLHFMNMYMLYIAWYRPILLIYVGCINWYFRNKTFFLRLKIHTFILHTPTSTTLFLMVDTTDVIFWFYMYKRLNLLIISLDNGISYMRRRGLWEEPENCQNRNDPDLVQAFLKNWWVESDFKAPNLPLSLRLKGSSCHYNSIDNNTGTK
jgi:hypothetical protein